MGHRCGARRRGRAREAGESKRASSADRPRLSASCWRARELPGRRRLVRGSPADLVALRVPRRPRAGGHGVRSCASSYARASNGRLAARAQHGRRRRASCSDRTWRRATVSGILVAVTAVLSWWACNAFLPLLGGTLATEHAVPAALTPAATRLAGRGWKAAPPTPSTSADSSVRSPPYRSRDCSGADALFVVYFLFAAGAPSARRLGWSSRRKPRLTLLLLRRGRGLRSIRPFPFYLPELFPTRLRATGAGLLLQHRPRLRRGRPVSWWERSPRRPAARARRSSASLFWVALMPLTAAILARRSMVETRGQALPPSAAQVPSAAASSRQSRTARSGGRAAPPARACRVTVHPRRSAVPPRAPPARRARGSSPT